MDGGPQPIKDTMQRPGRRRADRDRRRGHARGRKRLHEEGVPVVGVPKTIDNDLGATDYTFGFDTAVTIATEAIDRLHTTAESHHRVLICEVMGRHAGWIALHSGIAGGANVILIPERPFDIDKVCEYVEHRFATRRYAPIIVVAEGALPLEGTMATREGELDSFGHVRLVRASARGSRRRSTGAPATRRGRRSSATSSGAARRRRTTGCWRPASGCTRSTPYTPGPGARWSLCTAPRSIWCRWRRRSGELKTVPPEMYEEAEVFFG